MKVYPCRPPSDRRALRRLTAPGTSMHRYVILGCVRLKPHDEGVELVAVLAVVWLLGGRPSDGTALVQLLDHTAHELLLAETFQGGGGRGEIVPHGIRHPDAGRPLVLV